MVEKLNKAHTSTYMCLSYNARSFSTYIYEMDVCRKIYENFLITVEQYKIFRVCVCAAISLSPPAYILFKDVVFQFALAHFTRTISFMLQS